jgi:hypothetical protein
MLKCLGNRASPIDFLQKILFSFRGEVGIDRRLDIDAKKRSSAEEGEASFITKQFFISA